MNLLKNYNRELEKLQLLLTTIKTTLIDTEINPQPYFSYLSSLLVSFKNITEKLVAYCPMEFEYFENLLDDINIAIFKLESSLKLLNQELIDFNNLIFEYNSYTNETYTEITFPNGHYVYIQLTTLTNPLKENLYQLEIYAGSFNKEIQKYQNKPYTKEEVIEILHLIQLLPTN